MSDTQLAAPGTFAITSFEDMDKAAQAVAGSGMFGITKKEQAICLFMICQAEGINPIMALRRYHLIEGRPAMRADSMQGEFIARGGAILWHVRSEDMVSATFFRDGKKIEDDSRFRAVARFDLLWKLEFEKDLPIRGVIMRELAKLSMEGEETILRTFLGFETRGITQGKDGTKKNWASFPTEMLTARVASAGIRVVDPGLIAGIYSPDELEDAVLTPLKGPERATGPSEARDKAAMEAMIEDYHREAKETKSPARKSELLGLANDLRIKIEEMDAEKNDAIDMTPVTATPKPEPLPVSAPNEKDELELLPAETSGESARVKWQDYVLRKVKSPALKGKRLGDFTPEEIGVIWKKAYQWLSNEDPEVRVEANYIQEAQESWDAAAKADKEAK